MAARRRQGRGPLLSPIGEAPPFKRRWRARGSRMPVPSRARQRSLHHHRPHGRARVMFISTKARAPRDDGTRERCVADVAHDEPNVLYVADGSSGPPREQEQKAAQALRCTPCPARACVVLDVSPSSGIPDRSLPTRDVTISMMNQQGSGDGKRSEDSSVRDRCRAQSAVQCQPAGPPPVRAGAAEETPTES